MLALRYPLAAALALALPAAASAFGFGFDDLGVAESAAADQASALPLRQAFERLPTPCPEAACARGAVRLLSDGPEAWVARWKMIEQAESTIDTVYFILADDVFGQAFLAHLLRKAKQGVKVRLMLDATGSKDFKLAGTGGKDLLQELVGAGAEVKIYVPMWKGVARAALDLETMKAVASNHDKILVVDGEWAITGGRNISADYYTSAADHPGGFEDTDVLIRGAGPARDLTRAFEREWQVSANEVIEAETGFNLRDRSERLFFLYHAMDRWLADAPLAEEARAELRGEDAREPAAEALLRRAERGVAADAAEGLVERHGGWQVVSQRIMRRRLDESVQALVGYPDLRGAARSNPLDKLDVEAEIRVIDRVSRMNAIGVDNIAPGLVDMFRGAEQSIWIANPYVVLIGPALQALREAGAAGVHTTILTNSPTSTDSLVTQAYFLQQWPSMLADVPNTRLHVMNGERKLHAKVAVLDDRLSLVGTYNMDLLSSRVNSEVAVAIWSEEFAAQQRAEVEERLNAPANDAREYTIARDASGAPVRDDQGRVQVATGPEDHITPEDLSWIKRTSLEALEGLARATQDLPSLRELAPVGNMGAPQ